MKNRMLCRRGELEITDDRPVAAVEDSAGNEYRRIEQREETGQHYSRWKCSNPDVLAAAAFVYRRQDGALRYLLTLREWEEA